MSCFYCAGNHVLSTWQFAQMLHSQTMYGVESVLFISCSNILYLPIKRAIVAPYIQNCMWAEFEPVAVTTKCITAKKSSQNLNAKTARKKGFSNTGLGIARMTRVTQASYGHNLLVQMTGLNRNRSHWTELTVSTAILQLLESGCLPSYNFSQACSLLHDCTARYYNFTCIYNETSS